MSLSIPVEEFHTISSLSFKSDELRVRFLADLLPDNFLEFGAWELHVIDAPHASGAFDFLSVAKERGEPIVGYEEDGFLVLAYAYDDVFLRLPVQVVTSTLGGLNREELSESLLGVKAHFEQNDKALTAINKRLNTVIDLMTEKIRRTEIKASSHQQDSTAGVLYAQQIQLLKLLKRELQG